MISAEEKTMDNFETYAKRNEEKGDRRYARELRDAGRIVRRLVRKALERKWQISVHDSEEWTLKRSTSFDDVMAALFTTDADTLLFRDAENTAVGKVFLVYGNAGYEVISDYSDTSQLNEFMREEIDPFVTSIEAGSIN
jgi:hypothetical protein